MNTNEIEQSCHKLVHAYARFIDFRDYEGFAALFAEDGELETARPLVGPKAIFESLMKRPDDLRSRHVMSNVHVEVIDERNARGISYLTLYRHRGAESLERGPVAFDQPAAVGHYEDRFTLTNEGWRFARRKLHLAFRNEDLL